MGPRRTAAIAIAAVIAGAAAVVALARNGGDAAPTGPVKPVACPPVPKHVVPQWSAASIKLPRPGPSGEYLTHDEVETAVRVFAGDPLVRHIYARAGVAPTVNRIERNNLTVAETMQRASPHAHMAALVAYAPHDVCIPGPHPRVIFDTDHIHTSDPRHYEVWNDPGAWRQASAVVACVDLYRHVLAGLEATNGNTETFPPHYRFPRAVIDRAHDMSD